MMICAWSVSCPCGCLLIAVYLCYSCWSLLRLLISARAVDIILATAVALPLLQLLLSFWYSCCSPSATTVALLMLQLLRSLCYSCCAPSATAVALPLLTAAVALLLLQLLPSLYCCCCSPFATTVDFPLPQLLLAIEVLNLFLLHLTSFLASATTVYMQHTHAYICIYSYTTHTDIYIYMHVYLYVYIYMCVCRAGDAAAPALVPAKLIAFVELLQGWDVKTRGGSVLLKLKSLFDRVRLSAWEKNAKLHYTAIGLNWWSLLVCFEWIFLVQCLCG